MCDKKNPVFAQTCHGRLGVVFNIPSKQKNMLFLTHTSEHFPFHIKLSPNLFQKFEFTYEPQSKKESTELWT